MDDLDRRLRTRLELLADAVPLSERSPLGPLPRATTRARASGFSALAAATSVVLVVGIAIVAAGRGAPAPFSPHPLASPSPIETQAGTPLPSPTATSTPAPTSLPSRPPADVALPFPDGCPAYDLAPRRCAYIIGWALAQAGETADDATTWLLGDPECDGQPAGCAVLRTTAFIVRIRVIPTVGRPSDHPVFCGLGGEATMLCTDTPLVRVRTPIAGYHDVPCGPTPGGEPGSACATPLPTIAPAAARKAVPLEVGRIAIPIDHDGAYSIDLGDAVLPNGILTEATATLVDERRSDVLIPDGIRLKVVGADGKPLENAYTHGWRRGTERVHVRLVFSVESFDPGVVLELVNVVVR